MKQLYSFKMKTTIFITLIIFSATLIYASTPCFLKFSTNSDFEKGECKQVSINSDGQLYLSPKTQVIFDSGEPFLWSWAQDTRGNTYVGSGNAGKVFQIDSKGNSKLFFDAEELEVYALAVDKANAVYIATSPDGKIYKVDQAGKSETYFDPTDKYIWSLIFDSKGNLFAATGDSGIIYKITAPQKGTIFYDSEETHIRCLRFDKKGNLLAGSVGKGLLYQISPQKEAFVLFDTPFSEIHSIEQAGDGTIYIGAFGKEIARLPARQVSRPPEVKQEKEADGNQEPELTEIRIEAERIPVPRTRREKSAIYKLSPDGAVQNIWEFKSETVYSLVIDHDGTLVVGTGDKGKIYRLTSEGKETLLFSRDESQVTTLHRDKTNRIYLCTSNMGKLVQLDAGYENSGTYESDIIRVNNVTQWGAINWQAEIPRGTNIELFTRSGNTAKADQTWSSWSKPYTQQAGQHITNPPSRYLQWKAVFKSSKKNQTPKLKEVSIAYLEKNMRPTIIELLVQTPNASYGAQALDEDENLFEKNSSRNKSRSSTVQQSGSNSGKYTISWYVEDDNNDELEYNLYYKAEKETNWKLLKEKQKRNRYSLNGRQLPDGIYLAKLAVSDAPSNPANMAKKAEKISEPFKVDNAGPVIENLQIKQSDSGCVDVTYQAKDLMFPIRKVEYVIDVGDWQLIYPVDQICDSKTESFEFKSTKLTKGKHTIVIRAYDRLMNIGFGKFHFEVN